MTTNEEFQKALELVIKCKATLNCGCQADGLDAAQLAYQCKSYLKAFEERFK